MAVPRIAVIGGDGIGPEVIDQAVRVASAALRRDNAAVEWNKLPWSGAYYQQTGVRPADGWEILRGHDAVLLVAIGHPEVPDHITLHGLLLPMRHLFHQYVNLRPAYLFDGVPSPLCDRDAKTGELRPKPAGAIDMLVYRENTEGEYAPVGGRLYQGTPSEVAIQTSVFHAVAANASCEPPSRGRGNGAARSSPRLQSRTPSSSAWSSGTKCLTR